MLQDAVREVEEAHARLRVAERRVKELRAGRPPDEQVGLPTGRGKADRLADRFGAGFLEHVPVLAWVKDAEGCHLYANGQMHGRFGVAEGSLVGRGMEDLGFAPDEVEELQRHDRRVIQTGEPFRGIERVSLPGQPPQAWFVTKFPLPFGDEAERLTLAGGLAVEVTEALAWQEQLEMALEASQGGTWSWEQTEDAEEVLRFSAQCWRMLGLEPDERPCTTTSWRERIHPDDRLRFEEHLGRVLVGEQPRLLSELRLKHTDGSWRWVQTVGRAIRHDEQGRPSRMVGLHLDIHRLKSAELSLAQRNAELLDEVNLGAERLEESEARFRSMATSSPLMLWVTHEGEEAPWMSPELERFFEGRDGRAGKILRDWIGALAVPAASGAPAIRGEVPFADADGRRRWMLLHGRSRHTPAGDFLGYVGTVVDVTEQHEASAALERSKEQLEAEVARQTGELRHRLEELAQRNRELDSFAHIASHDLRSPLRTITGFTEFLQPAVADDPEASDFVRRILQAGGRMAALLDSLLAFASVGRGELVTRPVPLDVVLAEVCEDLAEEVRRVDAEVDVRPLPVARGDATMLRQVFQNLLGNALKYHGDAPPRVLVSGDDLGGGRCRVTVADAGSGFAPEAADRLFEPFSRFHGADVAGSGVGLSIVRRVVERHGGAAFAEMVTGEPLATRFHVELPSAEASGGAAAASR